MPVRQQKTRQQSQNCQARGEQPSIKNSIAREGIDPLLRPAVRVLTSPPGVASGANDRVARRPSAAPLSSRAWSPCRCLYLADGSRRLAGSALDFGQRQFVDRLARHRKTPWDGVPANASILTVKITRGYATLHRNRTTQTEADWLCTR